MRPSGWLILLALIAVVSTARGDDSNLARQRYERGTMLYDLGKYLEAARAYEEAYSAKQDPALLFNIAQAYRLGGDYPAALRAYRSFLRRMPNNKARADVEHHIETLERLVEQQKSASSSPPTSVFPPGQNQLPPEAARPETKPERAAAPAEAVTTEAPPKKQPIYKKWWLWTAVGAVVVVGVAVGVGVALTTPANAPAPAGTIAVKFP